MEQVDIAGALPGSNAANTSPNRLMVRPVEEAWAAADALPGPLRAVVCAAPFDLDCVEIVEFWQQGRQQGWPIAVLANELLRCLRRVCREEAGAWGPGYPDIPFTPLVAQRRRPARRGRLVL